jgi:hypothetical protein
MTTTQAAEKVREADLALLLRAFFPPLPVDGS